MIDLEMIQRLFILFLIYSFSGWIIEVIVEFIYSRKLINRGFLIGPVCPVYGFGAVFITLLLSHYSNDYFAMFGLSFIICGALEYFTSYILEKIFNARWWDYSNEKFNIKGRICLENLIWFGIAGIAVIKVLNPMFDNLINIIPNNVLSIFTYTTLTIFIIDVIVSLTIIKKIRSISEGITNQLKDNTEEISKKVREKIQEQSAIYRRVLKAFPHVFSDKVKHGKEKIVNVANELKTSALETKEKTITNINNVKELANNKVNKSKRLTKYRINKMKQTISKSKIMTLVNTNKEKETKNEKNSNTDDIDNN